MTPSTDKLDGVIMFLLSCILIFAWIILFFTMEFRAYQKYGKNATWKFIGKLYVKFNLDRINW